MTEVVDGRHRLRQGVALDDDEKGHMNYAEVAELGWALTPDQQEVIPLFPAKRQATEQHAIDIV
jgi:hypothetical protein